MKYAFISSTIALATLLAGCSVTRDILPQQSVPEDLYLRGVFNWWEADEAYRLSASDKAIFSTTAELIADGQPYDFRFADKDWSPGANCGYENATDQSISLNQVVIADCDSENNHFQFTPPKTDTYRFSIDFSEPSQPKVTVTKA
ncbi:hypothetical protein HMF8227_00005 [Saliniradius amylolyticus]|uniref:Pullulanase n=1 Tax=Saliniradius amylolyticus TaxID=2183582 RepID=A0A2S2DYT6_9ALTE|nr:hypothetical protein [Saliniradius amylolyticus]AWL10519.1 hypothetical protein HMF8227_00005 [Saliniradius amylolyticus]